jgi:hypothetical protein
MKHLESEVSASREKAMEQTAVIKRTESKIERKKMKVAEIIDILSSGDSN